MGACNFIEFGKGETADEAFERLVDQATWEYGHNPYNGTISTTDLKPGSVRVANEWCEQARKDAIEVAKLDRYGKKWESRAIDCGKCGDTRMWAFYGWAAC